MSDKYWSGIFLWDSTGVILADFVCTFVTVVVDIVQKDCVYGQFFGFWSCG